MELEQQEELVEEPVEAIENDLEVEELDEDLSDDIEPEEIDEEEVEESELEADAESQPETEGFEEMELDGEIYQVPKALKEGYMKNADYTQKTTEVAQQRKQLEQEAQQAQIMYEVVEQEIEAKSRLTNINQELQEMQNIDWDAYFDQDPISAQKTNMRMQQLANEQVNLKTHLQNAYNQRTEIAKQATANRITATKDYAAKNIPGWSPSSYDNIVSEAINEHGFTQEQIDNAMSPSVLKILHLAQLGTLSQKKQAKIPTLSQKAKATKPLKKVSSRSSGMTTKDPSQMTMAEYDKWSAKTFK